MDNKEYIKSIIIVREQEEPKKIVNVKIETSENKLHFEVVKTNPSKNDQKLEEE
jgi:hypothetical protein